MYSNLTGKGIIAFSDPAGAKSCLGLAMLLRQKYGQCNFSIYSNKEYEFYSDWELPVIVLESFASDVFDNNTKWVFTGTSHPESSGNFELKFIEFANSKDISSWSIVDHWTSIGIRFQKDNKYIFPDKVIVLDEKAKTIAIKEGVPEKLLFVHSNPYLEYIRELWKPSSEAIHLFADFKKQNRFSYSILYAPDPLSLRNEDKLWGFNEVSVLRDLLETVKDGKDIALLIRKHPLQPLDILEEVVSEMGSMAALVEFVQKYTNLDLMYFSDLIIGFHSNFLIEADALSKKIIRYYPAAVDKDPLSHISIGDVVTKKEDLKRLINQNLRHE